MFVRQLLSLVFNMEELLTSTVEGKRAKGKKRKRNATDDVEERINKLDPIRVEAILGKYL